MPPIRRLLSSATLIASLPLLGGCAESLIATWAGAEVISIVNTDKTLLDNLASLGPQDCSLILKDERGGEWCVPDDDGLVAPLPAQTKYCYRTLARVTCYSEPSPEPHDTLVGVVVPRTRGLDSR